MQKGWETCIKGMRLYIKNMNGKNKLPPQPIFLLRLLFSPNSPLLSSLQLFSSLCYSLPLSPISSINSSFHFFLQYSFSFHQIKPPVIGQKHRVSSHSYTKFPLKNTITKN